MSWYPLRDIKKLEKELEMNEPTSDIPSYADWLAHDYTQAALRDIYDTLVIGANPDKNRPFWRYVMEVTQKRFEKQRNAVFRHSLAIHKLNGDGHAIDNKKQVDGSAPTFKPHLSNLLARAFIARAQQIELLGNASMKDMEEVIADD